MTEKAFLVDDQSLEELTGVIVEDFSGLYAPGLRKGADTDLQYQQGSIGTPGLQFAAYAFSIGVAFLGDTEAEYEAALRTAITALIGVAGDSLVTFTRRLAKVGGGYDEHKALGRFVATNSFSLFNARTGTGELQFVNLSGAWTADDPTDADAVWVVP